MTQVLVVELDASLRGSLHIILADAGYDVIDAEGVESAVAMLASVPYPMLVVWSNAHADHHLTAAFFAHVVSDECLATRHQYILLSTSPSHLPDALRAHLVQLHVPVLGKPFDMDALLTVVQEVSARLISPVRDFTHGTDSQP